MENIDLEEYFLFDIDFFKSIDYICPEAVHKNGR